MAEGSESIATLVRNGASTPVEVRDHAFRLWVQYGRSWKRTSDATGVEVRTLHNWSDRDQWETRRKDAAASFLPGLTTEGGISMRFAGHNAAIRLQQITYDRLEHNIPIDYREAKALVDIVKAAGLSIDPTTTTAITPPNRSDHPDIRSANIEDVQARERQLRNRE